jgi:hypothetical protein
MPTTRDEMGRQVRRWYVQSFAVGMLIVFSGPFLSAALPSYWWLVMMSALAVHAAISNLRYREIVRCPMCGAAPRWPTGSGLSVLDRQCHRCYYHLGTGSEAEYDPPAADDGGQDH